MNSQTACSFPDKPMFEKPCFRLWLLSCAGGLAQVCLELEKMDISIQIQSKETFFHFQCCILPYTFLEHELDQESVLRCFMLILT